MPIILWSSEKMYLRQKDVGAGWTPGSVGAASRTARDGVVARRDRAHEPCFSWAAEAAWPGCAACSASHFSNSSGVSTVTKPFIR